MADVSLVCMPFADLHRPSLALGILKRALDEAGIGARVHHPTFDFAARIGLAGYTALLDLPVEMLAGEWVFAAAAFPGEGGGSDTYPARMRAYYLERVAHDAGAGRADPQVTAPLAPARAAAGDFVRHTAERVLATRPRIVGCTSMFHQHCASLALLREIRARAPGVITVLGGPNCEAEMGAATHAAFPWVDCVVTGEADLLVADLCAKLLEHGRALAPAATPRGVIGPARGEAAGPAPARELVRNLDAAPVPCFDDYFAERAASGLAAHVVPALPVETSRGCFWGEKSHCTFCGLNGNGMVFRSKSPARARDEMVALATRHGVERFQVVDNILDMAYFDTLLADLAGRGAPYEIFYEVLPNLRREQVARLADAGVRWIQPGIESLHDEALRALGKANTVAANIQLLRWCRELGVRVSWSLLCGLPGEPDRWYGQMAELVPLLEHLQPPSGCSSIRFDRFSPYHAKAASFGLELRPMRFYADVYPLPPERLEALAYYFEDATARARPAPAGPGFVALRDAVGRWGERWYAARHRVLGFQARPRLALHECDGEVRVHDTRACAAAERHAIAGLEAAVLRHCDRARSRASLAAAVAVGPGGAPPEGRVDDAVAALLERRLLVETGGRLLALAVAFPHRPLDEATWPGGWTDIRARDGAAGAGAGDGSREPVS